MSGNRRANGEGTISFDPQRNRYVGRVTLGRGVDGRLVRKKFVGKTRSEVTKRMDEARRALSSGLPVPNERLTVATFLDQWIATLPGTVSEATEYLYRSRVRLYLSPALGHILLTKLSPTDVSRLLSEMESKGLAVETRRHTRAILRRALRRAEQEGLVQRNVAAIAEGPKGARTEGRTMTTTQAQAFLDAAARPSTSDEARPGRRARSAERLYAALVLTLALGLRRGETLGLSWDHVHLDTSPPMISVRRQLVRRPNALGLGLVDVKTRKSRRDVVLPVVVASALRSHKAQQNAERLAAGPDWQDDDGLVFTTPYGTPVDPRNFNRIVSDVAKRAGLGHWHPHELRHSAASLLLAMGVPLEVVSEVLGHSSIRITKDVYGHLLPEAKAAAAEAMDRALMDPTATSF
jgi:integrase